MARPSFYQLNEMVLAEEGFFDTLKRHWSTGWNLGRSVAPAATPPPEWIARWFRRTPTNVDNDPLASGADDPFGGSADDPFAASDDPFSEPTPPQQGPPPSFEPPKVRQPRDKAPDKSGPKSKKVYPFGAFSSFFIEKPYMPKRKAMPGKKGSSKMGGDFLLRQIRAKYHKH